MWIKNLFSGGKQQPVIKKSHQQVQNSAIFQIQQTTEQSSPLIDHSPDLRYKTVIDRQHLTKVKLPFPHHLIDHTQTIVFCKVDQHDGFQCKSHHHSTSISIKIVFTDKQLIISPNIYASQQSLLTHYLDIPLGQIQKIQLKTIKKQPSRLHLTLKDDRQIIFSNKIGDQIKLFQEKLTKFTFVNGINKFFAFQYRKKWNKSQQLVHNGWQLYNVRKQLMRQGVLKHVSLSSKDKDFKYAYKMVKNHLFELSPTYPDQFVVPFNITKQDLIKAAKFRTRGRLPALSYFYEYKPQSFSTLFRCSQIKTGVMGNRCEQDQKIVKQIAQSSNFISKKKKIYQKHNVKIYDARGYYAALGNLLAGKGYEKQQTYNCEVQFLNIPNIHAVRDSYTMTKSIDLQTTNIYQLMINSSWLDYISLILKGAKQMAIDMMAGKNVMVHCSDGWDRTAQLSSLCQMLLDPYYRTIEGLAVLIQKDWRSFGHKFRDRTGQYHPTSYHPYEKSPVFIQFLDCIYQLQSQFPLSFEYNSTLLQFLAKNVNSCIYGTFLTNNLKQANQVKIQSQTVSIWTDAIFSDLKEEFINPFYQQNLNCGFLNVSIDMKNLNIWKQHIFYQNGLSQVPNFALKKQKIINKALRSQFQVNQKIIEELKAALQIENLKAS